MVPKKLVVVGGGAAGFFCAVNAARLNPRLEVVIIEKSNKLLSKVKVSGGGRCNVTNNCPDISEMIKNYPRGKNFLKKTLFHFGPEETINWFSERGIKLKTELDGKMFPVSDTSQTIIACLLHEATKYKVKIILSQEVRSITLREERFILGVSNSSFLTCDFICLATGGYPKTAMFDWIKLTGHNIENPVPSLFTFNAPGSSIRELMGISRKKARVKILGTKLEQEGPILITHWGLSGPVILKLSAWGARNLSACHYEFTVMLNWIPDTGYELVKNLFSDFRMKKGGQSIGTRSLFKIPQRLWKYLLKVSMINPAKRWGEITVTEQNKLIKNLLAFEIEIKGKTTFKEEFVTCGGIPLSEVDPGTMMSRKIQNLFFAGEMLDVDGITGGFNFQHAWTSGFIAGKSIASSV